MIKRIIKKCYLKYYFGIKKNQRNFTWRKTNNLYELLIAEFLLQKTPASRVEKVFPEFIKKYPNIEALANASVSQLEKNYGSLGLNKRFTWMVESMKIITKKFNGEIPRSKAELLELPGIGNYTASAFLTFAYDEDVAMFDSNIKRFLSRYYRFRNSNNKIIEKIRLTKTYNKEINAAILDFSSLVCKKNPRCSICPIKKECYYYSVRKAIIKS
jgi:A/G-specific adenine glycosylase